MHARSILASSILGAGLAVAQTGDLGDALVVSDNPVGVTYVATLPESDKSSVRGKVSATAGENGKGVVFNVELSGFPEEGGPFKYHLHSTPVPEDGNCTETLAHLDPFVRGEDPKCDSDQPQTCEVGDLSGKYGEVDVGPGEDFSTTFTDLFASTKEGIGAFFGNRSLVVHLNDKTRIGCANFQKTAASCNETGAPQPTGTGGLTPSPPGVTESPPPFDGSATTTGVSVTSVGVLAAALMGLFW